MLLNPQKKEEPFENFFGVRSYRWNRPKIVPCDAFLENKSGNSWKNAKQVDQFDTST